MTTDDRPTPDGEPEGAPPYGVADARVEAVLRRGGDLEQAPPEGVWAAIRRELDGSGGLHGAGEAPSEPDELDEAEGDGEGAGAPAGGYAADERAWTRREVRRTGRGPGRVVPLLLAAAAGAGIMYAAVELSSSDEAPTQEQVLASGELGPVEGEGRLGAAEVVEREGRQVLRVDLDEVPDARDGYLEVWLLRPDVSGLVTLGVLDGAQEEFVLPAGLDLGEFPVVDISREHLDGDPGHGGDSLVRGQVG